MNFEEFKQQALRTESVPTHLNVNLVYLKNLMELCIAASNALDLAKKQAYYGKTIDERKMLEQLRNASTSIARLQILTYQGDYQRGDGSNAMRHKLLEPNIRITHGTVGMFTEAGELLEATLKSMTTGELDTVNVAEETSDSDWYKAIIHDETGVSEEQTRLKVINKLRVRYPEKFTSENAINRDLTAERKVLEG